MFSGKRKSHVAALERVRRKEIHNELGRSRIVSCFEELGFYFRYNKKLWEGFNQEHEKIIQAALSRMDGRMVTEGSAEKLLQSFR